MVNGTVQNFGKNYEDDLRVIFYQWPKLYLGLAVLSNQKILKGIYILHIYYLDLVCLVVAKLVEKNEYLNQKISEKSKII